MDIEKQKKEEETTEEEPDFSEITMAQMSGEQILNDLDPIDMKMTFGKSPAEKAEEARRRAEKLRKREHGLESGASEHPAE